MILLAALLKVIDKAVSFFPPPPSLTIFAIALVSYPFERVKIIAECMIGRLIQKKEATRGRCILSHIPQ